MKSFVKATAVVLLVLIGSKVVRADPAKAFTRAKRSVVWIVNSIPSEGIVSLASGVLVDSRRRLVATNYHVVSEEETMDVFFAVPDGHGEVITDPSYYRENYAELHRLNYATVAVVVAKDREKDLAIVRVDRIPGTAEEAELADADPDQGDHLCIVGNQDGELLFRWTLGNVRGVERMVHTFDDGLSVDFRAVRYYGAARHGNSGCPVLNDDGQLVAIHECGDGNGNGTVGWGVHVQELKDLLATVRQHRVFSIANRTRCAISYEIRRGEEWESFKLQPGYSLTHSFTADVAPEIRFDWSFEEGYQERRYDLGYHTAYFGQNGKPDLKRDAREYAFKPVEDGVDLYDDE